MLVLKISISASNYFYLARELNRLAAMSLLRLIPLQRKPLKKTE